MSAPANAYHNKAVRDNLPADYRFCKFLPEYASIKEHFYLDAIIKGKDAGVDYFIGACFAGSYASSFHSDSRKGRVFDNLILYKDGGLHTLGFAGFGNTANEARWANWINLPLFIRTAYYFGASSWGYSYKINSGSWTQQAFGYGIAANGTLEIFERGINLTPALKEGDTISFRAFITNSEGTFWSSNYSFTAAEEIYTTGGNLVADPPQGVLGDGITIYALASTEAALADVTTSDANTGIYLYSNEYFNSSNYLADGYYLIGGVAPLPGGNTKLFQVKSGQVRKYVERVVQAPKILLLLVNLGMMEFPEFRIQAVAVDAPNGFTESKTLACTLTYYALSGGIYTPVGSALSRSVVIEEEEFTSLGGVLPLPPDGATHAQVTTGTTVSGMTIESPFINIIH